ncbi:hypothetical protein [Streptomyces sp. NPDC050504]|uniref:hypothetical protein n=1 Tax=Streptomyces sp. NPDC050504 TaxID=3365618 RepID=UPI0037AA59AB
MTGNGRCRRGEEIHARPFADLVRDLSTGTTHTRAVNTVHLAEFLKEHPYPADG